MARKFTSAPPEKGDLERMLRQLAPEIARIFREHGATEAEARRALGDALASFSRKWERIANRERWLLRNLEAAVRAGREEASSASPRTDRPARRRRAG
jgi:uncharacterized membrane protein YccC